MFYIYWSVFKVLIETFLYKQTMILEFCAKHNRFQHQFEGLNLILIQPIEIEIVVISIY